MTTVPAAIEFDEQSHEMFVDGKEVALTRREWVLATFFLKNPRTAFTYAQIKGHCFDAAVSDQVVRTWAHRIRQKLGPAFNLVTLVGWGYRYDGPSS